MAKGFAELQTTGDATALPLPEGLGLLVDREMSYRHDKRFSARLRYAKLRHQAAVEDVDYRTPRGLDRALFQKLVAGDLIDAHDNLAICGPTGIGKPGLLARLVTRPAATTGPPFISASRNCSPSWRWPAAMAVRPGSSKRSRALIFSFSPTGASKLRLKLPKLALLMDEAEPDVLAHMTFPAAHRAKLHSTNPIERPDAELKRRTEVVGSFPIKPPSPASWAQSFSNKATNGPCSVPAI